MLTSHPAPNSIIGLTSYPCQHCTKLHSFKNTFLEFKTYYLYQVSISIIRFSCFRGENVKIMKQKLILAMNCRCESFKNNFLIVTFDEYES